MSRRDFTRACPAPPFVGACTSAVLLAFTMLLAGCRADTATPNPRPTSPPHPSPLSVTLPAKAGTLPAPGEGAIAGRLVDGLTGLAVPEGAVRLLELGRRTVSSIDGSFRFDAVPKGTITLVFGPTPGYVPASRVVEVPEQGVDIGLVALQPVAPATLIVPDQGGTVAGCGATRLELPPSAVTQPLGIAVTCLASHEILPAAPPAGRLPLAALHIEPPDTALGRVGRIVVGLPSQPRYATGVSLELLRLDVDRLTWAPGGTLTVGNAGQFASGKISQLGTYLIVAPPFGVFGSAGDEATITRISLAATPDGPASDTFRAGIAVVYLTLDYARMTNSTVLVRTADRRGHVLQELARPYTDSGHDNVPLSTTSGSWPAGEYVTSVYVGEPPAAVASLAWRVVAPSAAPPTRTPVSRPIPRPTRAVGPTASPAARPSRPCQPRSDWYAYLVQPGDTLYSLARRTGSTVEALMRANCLSSPTIYAGTRLALPRRPDPGPWPTGTPRPTWRSTGPAPIPPTRQPGLWPPTPAPPSLPTTDWRWPTQPAAPTGAPPTAAPPLSTEPPPSEIPPATTPEPSQEP